MFDLDKDPLELKNLSDSPKYQKIKKELTEELLKLQKQYDDDLDLSGVLKV